MTHILWFIEGHRQGKRVRNENVERQSPTSKEDDVKRHHIQMKTVRCAHFASTQRDFSEECLRVVFNCVLVSHAYKITNLKILLD